MLTPIGCHFKENENKIVKIKKKSTILKNGKKGLEILWLDTTKCGVNSFCGQTADGRLCHGINSADTVKQSLKNSDPHSPETHVFHKSFCYGEMTLLSAGML